MDQDPGYRHQWAAVNYDGEARLPADSDSGHVLLHGDSDSSAVMVEAPKSNSRSGAAEDRGLPDPRHIYVTKEDVSSTRNAIAWARAVLIGRVVPSQFHLQCEWKDGEHPMEEQPGRTFYIVDNNFAQRTKILELLGKGVAIVLKTSSNVALGPGAFTAVPLSDGTPVYRYTIESLSGDTSQSGKPGATDSDEQLREQVEKQMQNSVVGPWMRAFLGLSPSPSRGLNELLKFPEDFCLSQVEYSASSSSNTTAWVCEKHRTEGDERGLVKPVI